MRVADDVTFLKDILDEIDDCGQNGQHQPEEGKIVTTALMARGLLEVIERVNFRKYNHTLRTNIRAIRVITDPDHPGSDKVIYERDQNISLKKLCDAIVHLSSFTFNCRADGKHWIEIINDRRERYRAFYSDFILRLRSLVLSKRLVVLALCDLALQDQRDQDPLSFSCMSLGWILHQHLDKEDQLKLDILKAIFGIGDVPAEVLPNLSLSIITDEPDGQMTIKFNPAWEDGQDIVSPSFSKAVLLNLIIDFYQDRNNPKRVFN